MDGGINTRSRGTFQSGGMFLIQSIVLSAAGAISFTNIPANFNHLQLIGSVRTTQAVTNALLSMRFNGDASGNYDSQQFNFFGASSNSSAVNAVSVVNVGFMSGSSSTASAFTSMNVMIPFYLSPYFFKNCEGYCMQANPALNQGSCVGGQWRSTAAINKIDVINGSSVGTTFAAGTSVILYGLY
jgi:hypothetical protein